jgi:hypothetical protein
MLLTGGALGGCASTTLPVTSGIVEVGLEGAVPIFQTHDDPLLSSRLGLGDDESILRYHAGYLLEPGDVFSAAPATHGQAAPRHFGSQRLGQDLRVRLPTPAGTPVSVGFTAETREQWTTAGHSIEQQRQTASLSWSPRLAGLELQWLGGHVPTDAGLALGCDLQGAVRVPLPATDTSKYFRLTARDCLVRTEDSRYAGLSAHTWQAALAWEYALGAAEIGVSAVEPGRPRGATRQGIDPSYQLGLTHRQDKDSWSTRVRIAMRHTTAWNLAAVPGEAGHFPADTDTYWSASASVTWRSAAMPVSADWSHGADPLWFMPQIGQRSHRVGVRVDLSRVVTHLLPEATPQVGLDWNWSQAHSRMNTVTADSTLRLNAAVLF